MHRSSITNQNDFRAFEGIIMKEITDAEKKELLVDMLARLGQYLEKNSLKWFVAYGTLIGTIRHHGFIPWDDDVDIIVPRKDFFRLIHLLQKDEEFLQKNNMCLLTYDKRDNSYYKRFKIADTRTEMTEFGRLRPAVFIDVYPLDYIPSLKFLCLRKRIIRNIDNMIMLCGKGKPYKGCAEYILHHICLIANRIMGPSKMQSICEKTLIKIEEKNPNYAGVAEAVVTRQFCEASNYQDSVPMPFEGISVPVPVGYHTILTQIYGDYMTLPKEEDRHSHEYYKMYWK